MYIAYTQTHDIRTFMIYVHSQQYFGIMVDLVYKSLFTKMTNENKQYIMYLHSNSYYIKKYIDPIY